MRLYRIRIAIIAIILIYANTVTSQVSSHVGRNVKYVDSIERIIRDTFCRNSLVYLTTHKKRKVKDDLLILRALNRFLDSSFSGNDLDDELKKIKKAKIKNDESFNGLIKLNEILIVGNYLRVNLKLESIDSIMIRKKCVLETSSYGRCSFYDGRVPDFRLLKSVVAKELRFSIRISDWTYIVANQFLQDNLLKVAETYKDYKFNLVFGNSIKDNWIKRILYNQYNSDSSCCYSYLRAPRDFLALIKNDQIPIIADLLYSPNYFYSVNAMEALIFLASENKIFIDDKMKNKMEFIKAGDSKITIQNSYDFFTIVYGYKQLKTTDDKVVRKYRNSIR